MSEHGSRGRGHDASYAARATAHVDAPTPQRTPSEQATDLITGFARDVAAVRHAVEVVRQAHEANDPTQWQEAKQALERELARAAKALESARARASEASPDAQQQFAATEAALVDHKAAVGTLTEAPRGWKSVSREAEILAIVSATGTNGAKEGWDQREAAMKAEIDQLSVAECQTLARRLKNQSSSDPIATALASGVRMNSARHDDLTSYLNGARKRNAQNAARVSAGATTAGAPQHVAHPDTNEAVETAESATTTPTPQVGVPVTERESLDTRLSRVIETGADDAKDQLAALVATLDGSERRAVARRLETYRPGSGDELAARFTRLDREPRLQILAALRADAPAAYPFHAQIQTAFGAHDIGELRGTSSGDAADHGARAFTRAGEVTFGEAPDLHTAAHEAAHAVVQRAGLGPSGEGTVRDDFERHADAVADRVTRGESVEELLSAAVERSPGAVTPVRAMQRKELVLTSSQYVAKFSDQVIAAIDKRVSVTPLDAPHPRLPWSHARDPHVVISKAIRAYLAVPSAHLLDSVSRLVQPTNLVTLIEEAGTHHTAPGWRADVGLIIATALDAPIALSLRRMGTRLRAQLDVRDDHVRGSELVASSVLDAVIADALTEPGVLAPAPRLANGHHDASATAFAHGARDVNFRWLGGKDPSLWYWIEVTSPKDPTAEDVARTPLVDGETPDGSQDASQIIASPPFFAIPIARAIRIRAAVEHAPPEVREQLRGGPPAAVAVSADALATSTQADEVALAQAPHAAPGEPVPGDSLERIRLQLGFLRTLVAPWHVHNALWAAESFVGRRAAELAADRRKATRWAPVLAGQERLLHAASSELGRLLVDHGKHATPNVGPVHGVIEAYLHAASVAHLLGQGPEALAAARHRWQMLPLALADEHVRAAGGAVDAQQGEEAQVGQTAVGADDTTLGMERVRAHAANLRLTAARTSDVDPDEVEDLAADADTVAMRAHIHTLQAQILDLEAHAIDTGLATKRYEGGLPTVHALGDQLRLLATSWLGELTAAGNVTFGATGDGVPITKRRADRKQRGLATVHGQMDAFGKRGEIGAYFKWAKTQITDQRFHNKVNDFLLQLGIMIVTMQAGSALVSGARGLLEGYELMSELRGASVAFKLAETATQAVLAVGGQAVTGADVGLRDVAENGIAMLLTEAAMKPFAGLFAGNAAIEAEVKTLSRRAMGAAAHVGHVAIETGVSIAASHVARMATHAGELDAAATEEVITQGLSIAAARIVGHRTAEMHGRLEHAAREHASEHLATLRDRARDLSRRALANETPGRAEALSLIAEEHRLLLAERTAYSDAPAHDKARAANAAALGATDARFLDVPLQLAGLSPIVDGQLYEGDWATVTHAFKAVADTGLVINPIWDAAANTWHLHVGDRVVAVHVRDTAKVGEHGKAPTPEPAATTDKRQEPKDGRGKSQEHDQAAPSTAASTTAAPAHSYESSSSRHGSGRAPNSVDAPVAAELTRALSTGKPLSPEHRADMAELRRKVAVGEIDPSTLSPLLQEHLPKHAGIDAATARAWADDLANSNPARMSEKDVKADLAAYLERKEIVNALYEKAKQDPTMKLPEGVTVEQLELAVKGDPKTGERVPLTFSVQGGKLGHDINQAKHLFAEFQADLKAVFGSEGISDAVVVQLGSGTTGWSTAPGTYKKNGVETPKVGKEWKATSDTDFAIFSDQALAQAMEHGAALNTKNKQAGLFTTIKNTAPEGSGGKGLVDTPLGKKLQKLTQEWNARIYGEETRFRDDLFDFKLNLQSDKPFRSAVPVLQVATPTVVPTMSARSPGTTHAHQLPGREGSYLGVTIKDPRILLPQRVGGVDLIGRRDYHITVLSPPELAALSAEGRAKVDAGFEIPGTPQAGPVTVGDTNGTPTYFLAINWPEAQAFRRTLGLGEKNLHVSLSGGIGDAARARDQGPTTEDQ